MQGENWMPLIAKRGPMEDAGFAGATIMLVNAPKTRNRLLRMVRKTKSQNARVILLRCAFGEINWRIVKSFILVHPPKEKKTVLGSVILMFLSVAYVHVLTAAKGTASTRHR